MTSQSRALDAALWQFMLALYARPGVQAACLEIQEECGADIVLLLTWLYQMLPGREPLGATGITALQSHIAEWRARTVLPLRSLRVDLRASGAGMPDEARKTLRAEIKALELAAERTQVAMIAVWLAARPFETDVDPEAALSLVIGRPGAVSGQLELLRQEAALA